MKLTNNHNLPSAIHRAAGTDSYTRGSSRISVTQLIDAPQVVFLRNKHADNISVDVVDRIWSLLGTAVHNMLDRAGDPNHITEERLFAEIRGWLVSGAIDVQNIRGDTAGLLDYKITSVWSVMAEKPAWEYQLNLYAALMWQAKKISVDSLQICAILRDWKASDVYKDKAYPRQPIVVVDLPVWSKEAQQAYLEERVRVHQDAERANEWGEPLPECTREERWQGSSTYAVMRSDQGPVKRATRVFASEKEAKEWITAAKNGDFVVEIRPDVPKRCLSNYCGVRDWCQQWSADTHTYRTRG